MRAFLHIFNMLIHSCLPDPACMVSLKVKTSPKRQGQSSANALRSSKWHWICGGIKARWFLQEAFVGKMRKHMMYWYYLKKARVGPSIWSYMLIHIIYSLIYIYILYMDVISIYVYSQHKLHVHSHFESDAMFLFYQANTDLPKHTTNLPRMPPLDRTIKWEGNLRICHSIIPANHEDWKSIGHDLCCLENYSM